MADSASENVGLVVSLPSKLAPVGATLSWELTIVGDIVTGSPDVAAVEGDTLGVVLDEGFSDGTAGVGNAAGGADTGAALGGALVGTGVEGMITGKKSGADVGALVGAGVGAGGVAHSQR